MISESGRPDLCMQVGAPVDASVHVDWLSEVATEAAEKQPQTNSMKQ